MNRLVGQASCLSGVVDESKVALDRQDARPTTEPATLMGGTADAKTRQLVSAAPGVLRSAHGNSRVGQLQ